MIVVTPTSWCSSSGDKLTLTSILNEQSPQLGVFQLSDMTLTQLIDSNEAKEPAWVVINCDKSLISQTLSEIEIESNSRFVEVYNGLEYIATLKGVIVMPQTTALLLSGSDKHNDKAEVKTEANKQYHFSVQLHQNITFSQIRFKFLSIKKPDIVHVQGDNLAVPVSTVLQIIKLSLTVVRCRDEGMLM
jgi:hypothetical protein